MRVGLVVYDGLDATSGGYRYDRKLVAGLRRRGATVEVIALPWRTYPRHLGDNLRPSVYRRLDRPVDVLVQDELCHPSLVVANRRLRRAAPDRPIVAVVHHLRADEAHPWPLADLYGAVEGHYLRGIDGVVCNSPTTRRRVARHAAPPGVIAPPAADHLAPATAPPPAKLRERARREPFEVCFLGNLVPRKGLDTLIEALADLHGPWHGEIVGDPAVAPDYVARVRRLAVDRGIDDQLTFAGRIADAAVRERLDRAHVLAMPSRYEGFGMAYLEAMAHGTVPVASTAGGARDIIDDGHTGVLVAPDRPDALAARLEALRADRERLGALAVAARERYDRHPTWTETTDRVYEFLTAMVEENETAAAGGRGSRDR